MKRIIFNITKIKKLIAIFMIAGITLFGNKVYAVSIDSLTSTLNDGIFNVTGSINSGTTINTSYANEYYTYIKVGNNEKEIIYSDNTTIDGINVNISLEQGSNLKEVIVNYKLTNTTGETKTVKLGTHTDTELANNDYAAIYKDGHSKLLITQDDDSDASSYGTQLKIDFEPSVSTSWIGYYYVGQENIFNDGTVLSYTIDDDIDTALAYSWSNTLNAGESITYKARFGMQEAAKGKVNFYSYGSDTPTVKDVLIGGSVKTLDVHTEANYIYEWNTKKDGTGTYYPANRSVLITTDGMNLYELKYDSEHRVVMQSGSNATITSDDGESILHHGTKKYTITPKKGYKVTSVKVNGVEMVSKLVNNVLTLNDVMDNVKIEVETEPIYEFTYGANQSYIVNQNNELRFKINADYNAFANGGKVYVDDQIVDSKYYSYEDDDTLIILNKEYLDTLSNGNHTLKVQFNDGGEATTKFTIVKVNAPTQDDTNTEDNPKTGDNIVFYVATGILSMIGLAGAGIYTYRRKQKN